ncbi:hypothetical protein NLN82_23385 [Citrobacter portucalensis]|uniref:hypothetical protein n=1 Tax=Citrobacter portucalensis TaxID=1639133 RepID=UPI00226B4C09|nr:hypothetical protein [Citrobacter portucalensis]MCX9038972.1 hypothetical protein [Citrobacter portucalensis]
MSDSKKISRQTPTNTDSLSDKGLQKSWIGESASIPIGDSFPGRGMDTQIMNSFAPPTRPGKGGDNGSGNTGK